MLGTFTLAGCTTPEVKSDPAIKSDLNFYPDTKSSVKEASPTPPPTPAPQPVTKKKMYQYAPVMSLDLSKEYTATIKTGLGDIVVALAAKATPITVNNFVFLARDKFYDGTIFHRTIPGFMIQGGDPDGTGMGGPGYQFNDEKFEGEYTRGTVAMANAGSNTNGSQFFIMHKDTPLPPSYVIFGRVTSGMEVVDQIATAPTKPGGEGSSPVTPVVVSSMTITEK